MYPGTDDILYFGGIHDGLFHGVGCLVWQDGRIALVGQFLGGYLHGEVVVFDRQSQLALGRSEFHENSVIKPWLNVSSEDIHRVIGFAS